MCIPLGRGGSFNIRLAGSSARGPRRNHRASTPGSPGHQREPLIVTSLQHPARRVISESCARAFGPLGRRQLQHPARREVSESRSADAFFAAYSEAFQHPARRVISERGGITGASTTANALQHPARRVISESDRCTAMRRDDRRGFNTRLAGSSARGPRRNHRASTSGSPDHQRERRLEMFA